MNGRAEGLQRTEGADTMNTLKHQPTHFSLQLMRLRRLRHLTQKDLARSAGVSLGIVQSLEQARRHNPHLSTLLRLSQALQVSLVELVEDHEQQGPSTFAPAVSGESLFDQELPP
jgi:transcriptional regulator with XRE-family HTH domain